MTRAIWDLSLDDASALAAELGEPRFRGRQLYDAIVAGTPIERASNLPKPFREKIADRFETGTAEIAEILTGKDGTEKILYRLSDGNVVEGVFMRYRYGNTLCLSTQIGCRMNCAFCASGLDGLVRNLTAGEMLGEVASVNRKEKAGKGGDRAVTNLVLMGSGEPLDNYVEVLKFLRLVSREDGFGISPRNISLSTCGLVPEIDRLSEEGLPVNLTISLHAADDARRSRLMPVNKSYPIREVLAAAERYFDKTGRRIHVEYSLIDGENAGGDSARLLAKLLAGLNCHVNLIRLNPVKERGKRPAGRETVENFRRILEENGVSVTIRRSMGADIQGACGQLRRRFLAEGSDGTAGKTEKAELGGRTKSAEASEITGTAEFEGEADLIGNAAPAGNMKFFGMAAFSENAERKGEPESARVDFGQNDFSNDGKRGYEADTPSDNRGIPRKGNAETSVDSESPPHRSNNGNLDSPQDSRFAVGCLQTPDDPKDSETTFDNPNAPKKSENSVKTLKDSETKVRDPDTPQRLINSIGKPEAPQDSTVGNRNAPQRKPVEKPKPPKSGDEGAE